MDVNETLTKLLIGCSPEELEAEARVRRKAAEETAKRDRQDRERSEGLWKRLRVRVGSSSC